MAHGLYPFDANAINYTKCTRSDMKEVNYNNVPTQNRFLICPQITTSVGTEKIRKLETFDDILEGNNYDNFIDLFKIWKCFKKPNFISNKEQHPSPMSSIKESINLLTEVQNESNQQEINVGNNNN